MSDHVIVCSVLIDGDEAVFLRISARQHTSGMTEVTLDRSEVDRSQPNLLNAALGQLVTTILDRTARYPHATQANSGGLDTSREAPPKQPSSQIPP